MKEQRFVSSGDGTLIYAEAEGEGIPVVLCDGLGCDGYVWRYFCANFKDSYRLIHFQYRGHGFSDQPRDGHAYRIVDMCGDLMAVLDSFGLEKAVLVGHSMGCQVIFEFALRYPDRVAALVPVCGASGYPLRTFRNSGRAEQVFPWVHRLSTLNPDMTRKLWRRVSGSVLSYFAALALEVNGKLVRRHDLERYFSHLHRMPPKAFFSSLEAASVHSVESRLPSLSCPTLIVAGDRDGFTPVHVSENMARLVPDADLLVIPGGSHCAPLEQPELFHLRFEKFFEKRVETLFKKKPRRRKRAAGKSLSQSSQA